MHAVIMIHAEEGRGSVVDSICCVVVAVVVVAVWPRAEGEFERAACAAYQKRQPARHGAWRDNRGRAACCRIGEVADQDLAETGPDSLPRGKSKFGRRGTARHRCASKTTTGRGRDPRLT